MTDISINPVARRVQFTGNTGTGPFAFTFNIIEDADLAVYKNTTLLTLTTDYTVSTNADGTGSVTLVSAVVSTDVLTIIGARLLERTTDFVAGGDFFAASVNEQMDSQVIMAQQLDEKLTRALKVNPGDEFTDLELPLKADRLNRVLQFNATSGDPEAGPTVDEVSNAQTYATNAATSATSSATSASASASSASAASSSATAAAASETAAAASEAAAAASESAAATSETNAAASETAAASSASDAATSATAAASSATAAASSATAAASSASSASTSASNAATSETNAATSATAAAASQTAAAASAAAAAASYDTFDDRYLGSKTSDPTLDNDGNALVQGALYFNSTANEMRVYDGANWIAASSAGGASLLNYNYTATAGQTTFSGADDNAASLSYTQQNLIVTLNGIVLEDGTDYTASNGTSIVLTTAAAAGDELNIVAFKSFTTADMVPASTGGTFAAPVTINGDGAAPLVANRQSSDGSIVDLKKDGTTVGSIGTYASFPYLASTTNSLLLSNKVMPSTNTGGVADGVMDLGQSDRRFKDLYLSGGVYLGGTGAANLLDDYEEGTWTPRIADYVTGSTLVSAGSYSGTYTKIGNAVVLRAVIGATASLSSGTLAIWDLPFVVANNQSAYAPGACLTRQVNLSGGSYIIMEPTKGAAKCIPLIAFSGTTATTSQVTSAMCGSQITLNFTITYLTD